MLLLLQNARPLYSITNKCIDLFAMHLVTCSDVYNTVINNITVLLTMVFRATPLVYRSRLAGVAKKKPRPHQQQCRSNIRLCRKNRSTCSIRHCCFDIVAGVDGGLKL